jgi:nicotinamide-nucleotide amidase
MFPPDLLDDAARLLDEARLRGVLVATAESCTGGLLAALLTSIVGASHTLERGVVTYSNAAKTEMLGVPEALIASHGAVSAEVAEAMARGALARSRATLAVSITGIAGPGGGSAEKPVGLVHFGCARQGRDVTRLERRYGETSPEIDRDRIRLLAVRDALALLRAGLG